MICQYLVVMKVLGKLIAVCVLMIVGGLPSKGQNVGVNLSSTPFVYYEIDQSKSWCSGDAEFQLSPFQSGPGMDCLSEGLGQRWFSFVASSSELEVWVETGGSKGSLENMYVQIYDENLNAIACQDFATPNFLKLGTNNLIPSATYFIAVNRKREEGETVLGINPLELLASDFWEGSGESFTMCLYGELSNDFFDGAAELGEVENFASENQFFDLSFATGEGFVAPCHVGGADKLDKWFSFVATTDEIEVRVKTGGQENALKYPELALWDADKNLLNCASETGAYQDISLASNSLVPGNTYYFSVNSVPSGNNFSHFVFDLSVVNEVSNNHMLGAVEVDLFLEDKVNLSGLSNVGYTASQNVSITNAWLGNSAWFKVFPEGDLSEIHLGGFGEEKIRNGEFWVLDEHFSVLNNLSVMEVAKTGVAVDYSGEFYYIVVNCPLNRDQGQFDVYVQNGFTNRHQDGAIAVDGNGNGEDCASETDFDFANHIWLEGNEAECSGMDFTYNNWFVVGEDQEFDVLVIGKPADGELMLELIQENGEIECHTISSSLFELNVENLKGSKYWIRISSSTSFGTGSVSLCLYSGLGLNDAELSQLKKETVLGYVDVMGREVNPDRSPKGEIVFEVILQSNGRKKLNPLNSY